MKNLTWLVAAIVMGCSGLAYAADYTLSFEMRSRHEIVYHVGRAPTTALQVWADKKMVHEIGLPTNGPQWNVKVPFSVADPKRVQVGLRLVTKSIADPQVEIGNLRVKDSRGGDAALVGKWTPVRTDPGFLLHSWSFEPLPAFRNGFSLRHAYGMKLKDDKQYGEWRFDGAIVPSAHLQLRRLFEYPGCYGDLNFFDDWKNVTFSPARPKAGAAVTVTAKVRNAGSLDARGAKVSLMVDGKLAETKTVDIPAVSDVSVSFAWKATDGFHCFVVRAEAGKDTPQLRYDDNWLLRVLVVGEPRKAHPFLLFRAGDVPKIKARLVNPPDWYAKYYEESKKMAGWIQPENRATTLDKMEEPRAMVAAQNAFLALVDSDFRPLIAETQPVKHTTHEQAVAFMKGIWDFHRGWFSDAPCAIVNYAHAYDWTAANLSPAEDKEIRKRLAKAIDEEVKKLARGVDPRSKKQPKPGQTSYPARKRSYSQGVYIDACGIVVGALALAGDERADAWLHFGLNAIYEEILNTMTTPDGCYREGQGYMQMSESRSGAACWLTLAHIGANPFELYPLTSKMHDVFIRSRMPNGWYPPINDNRVPGISQALFASLYADPATRAAARWDWKNQVHTARGTLPDGHYGNLFLLTDTPEADRLPAAEPTWTPTQFMGDLLVFRSDWSRDAAYLCLNTRHFPSLSASHDQNDKNAFMMYAKKAFLAVDPGYGNVVGRKLYRTVTGWCRGANNPFNHNMVLVDGRRPRPRRRTPYTYLDSPFPENTFTTSFFDFGEAALNEWVLVKQAARDPKTRKLLIDPKTGKPSTRKLSIINHRRSVLFPHLSGNPEEHYFIVADAVDSLTDNTHTFDFILNGNCRRPYLDKEHLGDFVSRPEKVEDVPMADNLKIKKQGGGLEAQWLISNADGKDVTLRAFIAVPAPARIQASAGDGWLAYARPVARNRYLDARVEGVRNVRFLTVLYPDMVEDAGDNVKIERLGEGARITFPDGRIHVITIKDVDRKANTNTDADITWSELTAAGKLNACFLARGSTLASGGVTVKASTRLNTLALDLRTPGQVSGFLSADEEVTLRLGLGAVCEKAEFNGKPVKTSQEKGAVVLGGLKGRGELRLWLKKGD